MRTQEANHRTVPTQDVAHSAENVADALAALDNANRLRRVWMDLQEPANAARREYAEAMGAVRALMTDVTEHVLS